MKSESVVNDGKAERTTAAAVQFDEELAVQFLRRKRRTPSEWCRKYFLEGQRLRGGDSSVAELDDDPSLVDSPLDELMFVRYRKFLALAAPFLLAHLIWWTTAIRFDYFPLYATHWHMPVTMIGGAVVAGMTSEGGGAVAFPVMTFLLRIPPRTARDFSIMIQTVVHLGMSTSSAVIVLMRVELEWRAVIFGTLGAIPGAILGFHLLDPLMDAAVKKMLFVSVWGSFAVALWILNAERHRRTHRYVAAFGAPEAMALAASGFVGGIFTSFAGSGVDIAVFSTLALWFRVSEKTATPTTVVLMAIVSQFCFYWRAVVMSEGIPQLAWNYVKVCAPVVVTFAPLGSFFGSHFHRQTLAFLVYVLEAGSYVGFLCSAPPAELVVLSAVIMLLGYVFFRRLGGDGRRRMERLISKGEKISVASRNMAIT